MAIKRWRTVILPQTPLSFGQAGELANFLETADYVPGSAMRGAVARRLLQRCMQENELVDHADCPDHAGCPFWQVFGGQSPPLFRNAYVSRERLTGRPYPLTARTCKDRSGFKDPAKPDKHHGVFDTAVRQAVLELMVEAGARLAALYSDDCPLCGRSTKPLQGYYETAWEGGDYVHYGTQRPLLERITHTAINRARGVAEDAFLFTVEQLSPDDDYVFAGEVVFDEAYQAPLSQALQGELRLGRAASRGLGRAEVELDRPPAQQPLLERLARLNDLMAEEWRFYAAMDPHIPAAPDGVYFTLDLLSEAILSPAAPTMKPEPAELGLPPEVALVRGWARSTLVGGWHSAARMPRRTQVAAQRGSVYLFKAPATVDQGKLGQTLETLELMGVGQETERGYGQVVACAPIHLEVEPR